MPLDTRDDGVAAVLLITDDGSYVLTDSAFLDADWHAAKENVFVQHWRVILAPLFDSVVRTGVFNATLYWQNRHRSRPVDSTLVFRNGNPTKWVGPTATSYTDTVPSIGTYTYALKHFTARLLANANGPSSVPHSGFSSERAVTIDYPPHASFTVACQQLPCTFTDTSTDPDGPIVSWLWTFGDGDSSVQQNPSHNYGEGGWYNVRLAVSDSLGATDDTTIVAAPLQLAMSGPTSVKPNVTCEWDALPQGGSGGMTYSWRIGGQEVGTDEYLYWDTGDEGGFDLTLIGQAGDGQADTAAVHVSVTRKAASCVLKRG